LLGAIEKERKSNPGAGQKIDDALQKIATSKKRESVDLMELDLRKLISIAESIGMIHSQHKALSSVAAEYRNHVHPGKEARGEQIKFDEPEFDSTMATLKIMERDLSQHFSSAND
ncbi:MAG: hypothetical protein KGI84_09685, partial [Elusimicrobia bacterium]|nr:hypothetical protein [Elusimicrobiota bacterium]